LTLSRHRVHQRRSALPAQRPTLDALEAIERLARLRDSGALTEFLEQKVTLLGARESGLVPIPPDQIGRLLPHPIPSRVT
jgi:hypothetical protein